jgi:hypothetical protein
MNFDAEWYEIFEIIRHGRMGQPFDRLRVTNPADNGIEGMQDPAK